MVYNFTYEELGVLQQIFEKVDVNILSKEDSKTIKRFQDKVSNTIKEIEESIIITNNAKLDFEEQCRTNNFKYLCSACKDGMRPRCLNLHQEKYCSAIFESCKARIDNPNYKK